MKLSIISRHARPRGTSWQPALGRELRRRRLQVRLSQTRLVAPFTRAHVSAVERGRIMPSLVALEHMVGRLGVSLSEFLAAVERSVADGPSTLDSGVSSAHADRDPDLEATSRRRRSPRTRQDDRGADPRGSAAGRADPAGAEIGRASCRERV